MTTGANILLEAHRLVTGPRQDAYDHPVEDYGKVIEIFAGITGIHLSIEQAVTFMICVKLARMGTNQRRGQWHHDSVIDAAGYLACLAMVNEWKEEMRADA